MWQKHNIQLANFDRTSLALFGTHFWVAVPRDGLMDFWRGDVVNPEQTGTFNTWRSSSTNALSFSSACTTKRLPSSRCASTIQIVRPLGIHAWDTAATPSGFAEIVGDDFPVFHPGSSSLLIAARTSKNAVGLSLGVHNKASSVLTLGGHNPNYQPSWSVIEIQPHFQSCPKYFGTSLAFSCRN